MDLGKPSCNPKPYKTVNTFEARKRESSMVLNKYPDKIPVICEVHKSVENIIILPNNKYLVPKDLSIGQFLITLRKKIRMTADQSLFLFNDKNSLFPTTQLLSAAYAENKDDDGFIYFTVSIQAAFG